MWELEATSRDSRPLQPIRPVENVQWMPQRGWTDFNTVLDVVERELGNGPYLFGDWFTAAGSSFSLFRMIAERAAALLLGRVPTEPASSARLPVGQGTHHRAQGGPIS